MSDLVKHGITAASVSRAVAAGDVQRLSRGTYRRAGAPPGPGIDLVMVASRAPGGVLCLFSAASLHGLGDVTPDEVWLAIPNSARPPKLDWPRIRPVRWRSPGALSVGVETLMVGGAELRVTGPVRTVVDMLRMRSTVGEDRALEVLRDFTAGQGSLVEVRAMAARFRAGGALAPYLSAFAFMDGRS